MTHHNTSSPTPAYGARPVPPNRERAILKVKNAQKKDAYHKLKGMYPN